MEKNEILIGREVDKSEYLVDKQYVSVGRKQARIVRKSDGLYIEDLDSAHGTFVNGKSVISKKINAADKITLGGVDYYELNIDKVMKLLPVSNNEFRDKMLNLKKVYDEFQEESKRLQTKSQEGMMLRMMPTMVLGSFTGILTATWEEYRIYIMVIGGILTVVVFLLALKIASNSSKKIKTKLNQLNENFELDYVCPACGASFKGKSWEFINRTGKCHICQRKFRDD